MFKKFQLFLYIFTLFTFTSYAQFNSTPTKELLLSNVLKNVLENVHYKQHTIDDEISKLAFDNLIKFYDFKKLFFLNSEVENLKKYRTLIDDEVNSGKIQSLADIDQILMGRIRDILVWNQQILSKPLDLSGTNFYETDAKKRSFAKNIDELKTIWEDNLKLSTINEIIKIEEEIKADKELDKSKKGKNKKKKKSSLGKEVLKTADYIQKKAQSNVEKDYKLFLERITKEKQEDKLSKYFNALAQSFDPHTTFLPPDDIENFNIEFSGKLEGIGAVLTADGPYIKVERVVPGSAAWKQKDLKPEDQILKVGQGDHEAVSIVGMDLRDAVKLIRGKKGSEVRLTIKRPDGSFKVIPIIRDVVVIEESYAKSTVLEHKNMPGKKVGYIYLPSFYRDFQANSIEAKNCTDDVRAELKKLKESKVDAVILDLRNDGGGSLDDARMLSGLFIKEGPIVQVKDQKGSIKILKDDDSSVDYGGPLIVMVNKFSASASEILAGALQDYGRAIIVGNEHTHGKGTVQAIINLDNAISPEILKMYKSIGSIKITIQKFYRINGASTQMKGVTPDIVFPDPIDAMESGEKYLDNAMEWDTVKSLNFEKSSVAPYDLKSVKEKSAKRMAANPYFKKITDKMIWLKAKMEDTKQSLNLETVRKKSLEQKDVMENFEIEEENSQLIVKHQFKIRDDEERERVDEFVKKIKKDPYLEETFLIINDMIIENKTANAKVSLKAVR
ncbi:MAG: carboxy terminal-processing peptidase [Bacteriovoracaceae bacterium]